MDVFKADLNDWPAVERFYEKFLASKFAHRFDISLEGLQRYFKLSLVDPRYAVLCVRDQDLVGLSILYEILSPDIFAGFLAQTFLHIVYVEPKAPREASDLMHQAIELWARSRKHNYIIGNVRFRPTKKGAFKFRAASKRYGYEPLKIMMGRPVNYEEG